MVEAPWKDRRGTTSELVDISGELRLDIAHEGGAVARGGLEEDVEVVGHEDGTIEGDIVASFGESEDQMKALDEELSDAWVRREYEAGVRAAVGGMD